MTHPRARAPPQQHAKPSPAMASARLAGRGGAHHHQWGEARAPLAPVAPSSDPGFGYPLQRRANGSSSATRPPLGASPASGYVALRPGEMAHREARALLRDRLAGELGQVRALIARIDTWQQQGQPKRRGSPPRRDFPPPPAKLVAAMRKRCDQILAKLRKDKRSIWFNAPVEVDRLGLHDYHTVIKCPMDLGTVKAKLAAGRYPSHDTFADDVRLTFNNALRYNPAGHEVHTFAGDLLASFEKMYKASVSWFEQELKLLEPLMPVPPELPSAIAPAQVKPKAGNVKMRKPKAREPNKREMTLEEKNLLRLGLESLPEEKMHNVLQIVRKRNGNPELVGGEIELDIDEMDVETQWELDRFVNNFKKALNKSRRAAIVNGENADVIDASVATDSDVLVNSSAPTMVDNGDVVMEIENKDHERSTTLAEQLDEYVDIGDEMPTATYQSVEIEKDAEVVSSGSSSSSDSGSSKDSVSESGNAHSLI
ncbi:transcription factor GTE2-like [Oryza brachyantha]|uniref:transcription factor GTE2-like n=1 Tax=Oryza brachyantha TaxID=4533 RepID=UPI001ADA46B0|nr:transcription factor GTE2-like [Oryza brachyantha]